MLESLLIKLQAYDLQLYEKQTPTQVFSCEIGEIFKNTFSHRTPLVVAFEFTVCRFATSVKQNSPEGTFQEFILNIP